MRILDPDPAAKKITKRLKNTEYFLQYFLTYFIGIYQDSIFFSSLIL